MKRLALGLALTAFALLAACSSKEEQAVDTMNEMADVLATVKDKSSAQAAAPKLKDLRKRMEDLGEDFGKDQKKTAEDMPPELKDQGDDADRDEPRAPQRARRHHEVGPSPRVWPRACTTVARFTT
jgi:hypothetical protein